MKRPSATAKKVTVKTRADTDLQCDGVLKPGIDTKRPEAPLPAQVWERYAESRLKQFGKR